MWPLIVKTFDKPKSIDVGHYKIGDHKIEGFFREYLEGFSAVSYVADFITFAAEVCAQLSAA